MNNLKQIIVFHTQENRRTKLDFPVMCVRDDAWLGEAYYFWKEETDAHDWGITSKKNNYDIYQCLLVSDNYLDTVFNEGHYYFWYKQLEKIARKIIVKTNEKPTLKELNDYIKDKNIWKNVDFIQFQDLPINSEKSLTKPIKYENGKVRTIAFRKRIQIAVYNKGIIKEFKLLE